MGNNNKLYIDSFFWKIASICDLGTAARLIAQCGLLFDLLLFIFPGHFNNSSREHKMFE